MAASTGFGKTEALKRYAEKRSSVGYVLATGLMNRPDFLKKIAQAFGVQAGGNLCKTMEGICDQLRGMERPLLIVDDFGKLNRSCQMIIQILRDEMAEQCGVVLAGTEEMRIRIKQKADMDVSGYRELLRRIGYWLELEKPSKQIVQEICKLNGIEDEAAVEYIARVAKNYGAIKELILNAKRTAERNGGLVTLKACEETLVTL